MNPQKNILAMDWRRKMIGWLIHAFTASGAFVGLLALYAISNHNPLLAFWLMGIAIVIDAVDGMFARWIQIKLVIPNTDGALLDNIVDFFNYTLVPAFFILVMPVVPDYFCIVSVIAITFASAYQFTQVDAKTQDHFFKGFPSYWNITIFYLFFWQMNPWVNLFILLGLSALSFVPIKYLYPSRLDYLTHNNLLRTAMLIATLIWGVATAGLLWEYPKSNEFLVWTSVGYLLLYVIASLYRTIAPLQKVSV